MWDVWEHRFELFRYCLGGGMHLRDNDGNLLVCRYRRITEK